MNATHHQQDNPNKIQNPIEPSEAPSAPCSVLGRIIESLYAEPSVPQSFTTAQPLPISHVGLVLHIYKNGELVRRAFVAEDNPTFYTVYFIDALTGLPLTKGRVSKSNAANFVWFDSVEHSNVAYRKHFGVQ